MMIWLNFWQQSYRTCVFALTMTILGGCVGAMPAEASRYASIVVNENTGKVLYSRSADKKLFPASLTKVMTLYLLFEALEEGRVNLNTPMRVSRVAAGRSPSKLGLRVNSSIKVEDAILALVTKSANDAATVISEHLAKSEREFAKKMTRKARALGMSRTTFKNASGLPHSQQKSTARDMARLAIAVRKDFPQYFHYFSRTSFSYKGRKYGNHNRLLAKYKGTDGIKTGYIRASGFNLIATVNRNNTRLVGVVFGGRSGASRNKHMIDLLDKQFKKLKKFQLPALQQARHKPKVKAPPPKPQIVIAENKNSNKVQPPEQQIVVAENKNSKKTQPPEQQIIVAENKNSNNAPPSRPQIVTAESQNINTDLLNLRDTNLPNLSDPIISKQINNQIWGIQVGSFARRTHAHLVARDARKIAQKVLQYLPAKLQQVSYGQIALWQLQFYGFDENTAREACVDLIQADIPCIALPAPQA